MGWFKSKPVVEKAEKLITEKPEIKYITILTITLKDSQLKQVGIQIPTRDSKRNVTPYIPFYKWYFMKDSECYDLKYDTGSYLIKRSQIDLVSIRTEVDNS